MGGAGQRVTHFFPRPAMDSCLRSLLSVACPVPLLPVTTSVFFEFFPLRFYTPGQKQLRRPKDIMCGNDLIGPHSLSPQPCTAHFPGLISFIVTSALWDGDRYETTVLWRRERRLQEDKYLPNLRGARAW